MLRSEAEKVMSEVLLEYIETPVITDTFKETFDTLGIGSLEFVRLCMDIEDRIEIEITSEMMYSIRTPNDLIDKLVEL